jgi:hypothetical protein
VEESLESGTPRVHLHAQFTFHSKIDRTHLNSAELDFVFYVYPAAPQCFLILNGMAPVFVVFYGQHGQWATCHLQGALRISCSGPSGHTS